MSLRSLNSMSLMWTPPPRATCYTAPGARGAPFPSCLCGADTRRYETFADFPESCCLELLPPSFLTGSDPYFLFCVPYFSA